MIDQLKLKMEHSAERQKLIASNIANINTPGVKTVDLEKFSFEKTRRRLQLHLTDPSHFKENQKTKFAAYEPRNTNVKMDGNDVSLEKENTKMANNNLEHQQTVEVYNKLSALFRMASQSERK